MKGGLAVMLAPRTSRRVHFATDLDVGLLFTGREELPFAESALAPFLEGRPSRARPRSRRPRADRERVGAGMPGQPGTQRSCSRGGGTHRSAWLGRNAIHAAIRGLAPLSDLPVRDARDGMVYREVASVTTIGGGTATNVVPDRATATVNFRYAPTHSPEEAERRLHELIGDPSSVEVVGNAPPGRAHPNPLVERLRAALATSPP